MNYKKIFFRTSVIVGFLLLAGVIFSNLYILSFGKNIVNSIDKVEEKPVVLVLGGGMKDDGVTMSEMQTDRVTQAVELYKAGKVQKILMTGDDGANNANEVAAMHAFAVQAGVPDENVDIDPHGYNTYKSCYRAKNAFNIHSAVVISQSFHLPRIIYFCSKQNIDVIPLSADLRDYGLRARVWPAGIREYLARVKAVVAGQIEEVGDVVVY